MTDSEIRADIKAVFPKVIFPFEKKWIDFETERGYIVLCSKNYSYKTMEDLCKCVGSPAHLRILREEYIKKEKKFMAEHPEFAKSIGYTLDFSYGRKLRYSRRHGKIMRKRTGQKIKPYVKRVAVLNRKISVNVLCDSDTSVKARGKR